jgi:hypothetical protein
MSAAFVASPAPARTTLSWLPVWWVEERSALSVDAFRIFIGSALSAHFFAAARDLPSAFGRNGLYLPPGDLGGSSVAYAAFLWIEQYASWARIVTCAGLLFSVGIVLGIAPRICAFLLFLVSTWIHRVAITVTSLDDSVVVVVAFWLCLLPLGGTLHLEGIPQRRRWRSLRVEGWTALLFVTQLLLLQANLALWRDYGPTWYAVGRWELLPCAVSGCLLLPSRAVRFLGIAALVVLHVWLALRSGLAFAHAAAVSAAILMVETRNPSTERLSPPPFSANAVVGLVVVALYLVTLAGTFALERTGKPKVWALATAVVLRDAGILVGASGVRLPPRPLRLRFESAGTTEDLRIAGSRGGLLLGHLMPPNHPTDKITLAIAEGAVRIHCRDHRMEIGKLWLPREEFGLPSIEIAEYQCETVSVTLLRKP